MSRELQSHGQGAVPEVKAVAIGVSAGAVDALMQILPNLPKDYLLPVFVVVHLPSDRKSLLAEVFGAKCKVVIKEAEDKEAIEPGTVYFAPPNYHLLVETDFTLSLSSDEPELYSRPSINVLFESAADAFGASLLAIILTGANSDGANGLRAAGEAGARVVVQEPRTAEASAMPEAALEAWPGANVLTIPEIAVLLKEHEKNSDAHKSN